MRWLVVFTVVPLLELYLLVQLARWIDFWPTVAITVVTGILGGLLAKHEGLRVWRQWRDAMQELRMPEQGVLDGLLVLVGGVLLITPGVLTDLTGTLLLLRPTRRFVRRLLLARIDRHLARHVRPNVIVDTTGSPIDPEH